MGRTILIVDDDPLALRLLEHHLTNGGYRVIAAGSGAEAVRVLLDEGPSIVITDWEMPEMGGAELCRHIREAEGFGWVYTIVLTTHGSKESVVAALDAGADDHLTKPFNAEELLARLRAGERIIELERDLARQKREIFRYGAQMEIAYQKLEYANEKLIRMARTDELTRLPNRRAAMQSIRELWDFASVSHEPLSCLMIDIDHFKPFNDQYGHDVGDLVLVETATALRKTARVDEHVYRLGGEEFLLLLPGVATSEAMVAAERFRRTIEGWSVRVGEMELSVTVSVGVAERTPEMQHADDLIKAADDALYLAKTAGRNRVAATGSHPRRGQGPNGVARSSEEHLA